MQQQLWRMLNQSISDTQALSGSPLELLVVLGHSYQVAALKPCVRQGGDPAVGQNVLIGSMLSGVAFEDFLERAGFCPDDRPLSVSEGLQRQRDRQSQKDVFKGDKVCDSGQLTALIAQAWTMYARCEGHHEPSCCFRGYVSLRQM
jgi:hypothetical protein